MSMPGLFARFMPRQRKKCGAPEPARAWKLGSPELVFWHSRTDFVLGRRGGGGGVSGSRYCEKSHALPMDGRVWLAAVGDERLERKEILKTMVSGTAKNVKSAFQLKMVMLWKELFVICENDMLRNGNLGLKMGVSGAAHATYPGAAPGCLLRGGGGQNCQKYRYCCASHNNFAPALKKSLSEGGGGGGSDTFFSWLQKFS